MKIFNLLFSSLGTVVYFRLFLQSVPQLRHSSYVSDIFWNASLSAKHSRSKKVMLCTYWVVCAAMHGFCWIHVHCWSYCHGSRPQSWMHVCWQSHPWYWRWIRHNGAFTAYSSFLLFYFSFFFSSRHLHMRQVQKQKDSLPVRLKGWNLCWVWASQHHCQSSQECAKHPLLETYFGHELSSSAQMMLCRAFSCHKFNFPRLKIVCCTSTLWYMPVFLI